MNNANMVQGEEALTANHKEGAVKNAFVGLDKANCGGADVYGGLFLCIQSTFLRPLVAK